MNHLLKAVGDLSPYPLGGRVGRDQFGVLCLQLFQPAKLVVEVIIGHTGVVQHIVLIVGLLQLPAQGQNFLLVVHAGIPPLQFDLYL